jgi:CelD/BcsL family acetyltransferase involved in cellulose biosynthesis
MIDLGTGDYAFKLQVANHAEAVAEGFVGRLSLPVIARRLRESIESFAERLPLGPASAWPGKAFRRIEAFRSFL